ncbi:calcium-dependent phosphotriesterase [Xylariaceae sp. FL0804]|nr:calcium-dependent phosphotriesterase [Xylariaceae sp. FL0804]
MADSSETELGSSSDQSPDQQAPAAKKPLYFSPEPVTPSFRWHSKAFGAVLGPRPDFELLLECAAYPFAHEAGVYFAGDPPELYITSNRLHGPGPGGQQRVQISRIRLGEETGGDVAKVETSGEEEGKEGRRRRPRQRQQGGVAAAPTTLALHDEVPSDLVPMANGGVNYGEGVLFCAQGSGPRAERGEIPGGLYWVARWRGRTPPTPMPVPVLTGYHGVPFNSPNDVVVSKRDGGIWFTDPAYGAEQGYKDPPRLPSQVYVYYPPAAMTAARVGAAAAAGCGGGVGVGVGLGAKSGGRRRGQGGKKEEQEEEKDEDEEEEDEDEDEDEGIIRAVADGFGHPNGLCFSPDERVLYVTDTDKEHGTGEQRYHRPSSIYAFDVLPYPSPFCPGAQHPHPHAQPFLANRRLFAFVEAGIPDGIKCDTRGNVYSGCGDGIHVWSAAGLPLGRILVPGHGGVANFCFGGPGELYALNEFRLWRVRLAPEVRGALLADLAEEGVQEGLLRGGQEGGEDEEKTERPMKKTEKGRKREGAWKGRPGAVCRWLRKLC